MLTCGYPMSWSTTWTLSLCTPKALFQGSRGKLLGSLQSPTPTPSTFQVSDTQTEACSCIAVDANVFPHCKQRLSDRCSVLCLLVYSCSLPCCSRPEFCHSAWLYVGQKSDQHVHFKIIDYGHAKLSHQRVRRKLPKIPVFEQFYQK